MVMVLMVLYVIVFFLVLLIVVYVEVLIKIFGDRGVKEVLMILLFVILILLCFSSVIWWLLFFSLWESLNVSWLDLFIIIIFINCYYLKKVLIIIRM